MTIPQQDIRADQDQQSSRDPQTWAETLERAHAALAPLRVRSVLELTIERLNEVKPSGHETLAVLPWIWMLVAKWVLQHENSCLGIGARPTKEYLARLANFVFEGAGLALKERMERSGVQPSVMLMMRSVRSSQFYFQNRNLFGLFRTGGLIRRLPNGHACKVRVEKALGLPVDTFIDLAITLQTAHSIGEGGRLHQGRLDELRAAYGTDFNRALGLLAKTPQELRTWVRREFPPQGNRSREASEFPVFKRAPIVKFASRDYRVWHQAVLDRCLDEYLHLVLSEYGQEYTQSFSKVFEKYLLEVAAQSGLPLMSDADYLARYHAHSTKKPKDVDAILTQGKNRLLIDAKMSLFAEDDILQETQQGTRHKLKNSVLKGLAQGRAVSNRLRREPDGDDEVHYLFIVTNKELHIGTGVMLQDLCGDASLVPDAEAVDHLLPPTHIFVASIHEFETLMCHVESGRIDLFRMLEQAALQCENLGDNRYALSEFYGAQLPQEVDDTWMPALLREEIKAAAERVERRFTPLARRS